MSRHRPRRKAKSQAQLQAEADQRKRNALIAVGVPAHQVEGDKVSGYETNVRNIRKPVQSIVDRWFVEGGPGFEEDQAQAIMHCRTLWCAAGDVGRLVANLDRIGGGIAGRERGIDQAEALTQLALYRRQFRWWDVFEDLVRFDVPATVAGEIFGVGNGARIERCKLTVAHIASAIAVQRKY